MDGEKIAMRVAPKTDFWRVTRHNYTVDNGHFYYQPAKANFIAESSFSANYKTKYDQAGLMLRIDEKRWMKCGVEFVDGTYFASTVITREFSDWSVVELPPALENIWFKVERIGSAIEIYFSLDGSVYSMMRQGYLDDTYEVQVGIMAASPLGEGFDVYFDHFKLFDLPK